MTFEELWARLEAKDDTFKKARERADITVEQLEYAYNQGYEAGYARGLRTDKEAEND